MFVIVSTFPSCTTPVFPWFPGFSLVQVIFGSTRLNALQINCKLSPSRTVVSPLISVILNGTKTKQSHVNFKDNWMACRHIRNTLEVIIHHFKIFANLAHANEIHACYDCANNTRTVPGLQSIISALICLPQQIQWTSERPLSFSEFFSQLELCIIIALTAVSRNNSVESNIETPRSCLQKHSFKK